MTKCIKLSYYEIAINAINVLQKSFYFGNRCIFVIKVVCGFIAKISGDALVIFYFYVECPRGALFCFGGKYLMQSTLNFKDTVERNLCLGKYYNSSPFNSRYRSWIQCRDKFLSAYKNGTREITKNALDDLSLRLAFYLASWGMYRGSSALLFNDYKVHIHAVKEVFNSQYDVLWNYDPFRQDVNVLPKWLFSNNGGLRDKYDSIQRATNYPRKTKSSNNCASNTLITKVMLGTWGCIPAYDEFFKAGLRYFGLSDKLSSNAIQTMIDKLRLFKEVHQTIVLCSSNGYTPMKVIDAYFWEIGYLSSFANELISSKKAVSQSRKEHINNYLGDILKDCLDDNKKMYKKLQNLLPDKTLLK